MKRIYSVLVFILALTAANYCLPNASAAFSPESQAFLDAYSRTSNQNSRQKFADLIALLPQDAQLYWSLKVQTGVITEEDAIRQILQSLEYSDSNLIERIVHLAQVSVHLMNPSDVLPDIETTTLPGGSNNAASTNVLGGGGCVGFNC